MLIFPKVKWLKLLSYPLKHVKRKVQLFISAADEYAFIKIHVLLNRNRFFNEILIFVEKK